MAINSNAPLNLKSITTQHVIFGMLVILTVGTGFWLLYEFRLAAFSLFVAMVMSTAISPAVEWLYRRQVPRATGVALIYLLVLALIVGFMLWVAPLVIEQAALFNAGLAGYYSRLLDFLRASPSALIHRLAGQLPLTLPLALTPANGTDDLALNGVAQVLSFVGWAGHSLFILIAIVFLAFYWTLEKERLFKSLPLWVPGEYRESMRALIIAIEAKVGGYTRGVTALSLVVGTLTMFVYAGLGLPAALLLGLTAGVMNAIPLIGPAVGAAPAVLVALASEPSKVVWVVVATALIQFIENTFLVPRVMGRTVGVNAVVTLLALAAFGTLFGMVGAFLAIPLAAIIQLLLDRCVFEPQALKPPRLDGRDYLSVLRVEAQDLVQDVRKQIREKPVELKATTDQVEDTIEAVASDLDSILAQVVRSKDPAS